MSATGIRPKTAGMIFLDLAPLQKQPPLTVPNHDRERTVKIATPVRLEFFPDADFAILMIDEHDLFVKHGWIIPPGEPQPRA
jgi:hypothetical protein